MSAYGAALAGGAINAGVGAINNYIGAMRDEATAAMNYYYNEKAAENADKRTRALYENYQSPEALLKQYKNAGLSPSLMFANGAAGAGGMTQGAQGQGTSGINAHTYAIDVMQGAQLGLMQAQARKTNAEADTIEGKNNRGKLEVSELENKVKKTIEETKNVGLKNAWYEYENARQSLQVGYEASTFDKKIETYLEELKYLQYKVRSAKVNAEIDENTQEDTEKLIKENVKNIIADTWLKRANAELAKHKVKLTDKQVEDLINQIATRGKQVEINRDTLDQAIKEWSLKNGLVFDKNDAKWHQIWERIIYGEHGQDLMVQLIKAFLHAGS